MVNSVPDFLINKFFMRRLKTFALFLLFTAGCMPAVFAQLLPVNPLYSSDVYVTNITVLNQTRTKVAVAENGYIYILSLTDISFYERKEWVLWRSVDDGKTFQNILMKEFNYSDITLADVDFTVTGHYPEDISVLIAEAGHAGTVNPHAAYCSVAKYKSNGDSIGEIYHYEWGTNTVKSISIATDFRSPDQAYAAPFSIAVAWTGTDLSDNSEHLTLGISTNGGTTFTNRLIYDQQPPKHLGRVSLSLGSSPDLLLQIFKGVLGIAFEMNQTGNSGDIGLLVNFYDFHGGWLSPYIITPMAGSYTNPSIALRQNVPVSLPSDDAFSMFLTFNSSTNINFYYPVAEMAINGFPQPTPVSFRTGIINYTTSYVSKDCRVAYNKNDDNYLFTFYSNDNERLKYVVIDAGDVTNSLDKGNYRDQHSAMSWNAAPSVDINLQKNKACFSWTDVPLRNFQSTLFDSEWSTVGIQESLPKDGNFSVYPNPAQEQVTVSTGTEGDFMIRISDISGREVKRSLMHGAKVTVPLAGVSPGIYFITLDRGNNPQPGQKLVIK